MSSRTREERERNPQRYADFAAAGKHLEARIFVPTDHEPMFEALDMAVAALDVMEADDFPSAAARNSAMTDFIDAASGYWPDILDYARQALLMIQIAREESDRTVVDRPRYQIGVA